MELIHLKKGDSTAAISTLGAEMIAYKDALGRNRLHDGDPAVWAGFGPILFPTIGTCKNGQITVDGKDYPMLKHGFVRGSLFTVSKKTAASVELKLTQNEETLKSYPFEFVLTLRHTLIDNGFLSEMEVENRSDRPMPFLLGGHPAFKCPVNPGESFDDYALYFEKTETGRQVLVNQHALVYKEAVCEKLKDSDLWPLDRAYLAGIDTLMLTNVNSGSVKLLNQKTGKGLNFSFPGFPVLAIWTKPHVDGHYLCLEPWYGIPSWENEDCELGQRPFALTLKPGEVHHAQYQMDCLD